MILVNDTNDEMPVFSAESYHFNALKSTIDPGSEIGRVYASDLDREDRGKLQLESSDDRFVVEKVEPTNGNAFMQTFLVRAQRVIEFDQKITSK